MIRTTNFTGFARSKWTRVVCVVALGVVILFIALMQSAQTGDPVIKVMKVGLGSGTITSTDGRINCGADCDENYASTTTVDLRAVPARSVFAILAMDRRLHRHRSDGVLRDGKLGALGKSGVHSPLLPRPIQFH